MKVAIVEMPEAEWHMKAVQDPLNGVVRFLVAALPEDHKRTVLLMARIEALEADNNRLRGHHS